MAHAGGRPPKWQSPEQVQVLIDLYFASTPESEWTITGLALALDTFRSTLIDYEEKDEFYYTIKKAKEKVHNSYEKDLRAKGRSGDIFALKNFGWSDKQEIDHTSKGEKITNSPEIAELTRQLNDLHRGASGGSDGGTSGAVGDKA